MPKTEIRKKTVLAAALAAVLLLCGCKASQSETIQETSVPTAVPTAAVPAQGSCSADPAPFLAKKVKTEESAALYRKSDTGMQISGYTEAGALFDIAENAEGEYL